MVLPGAEIESDGQLSQVASPKPDLYVPAPHWEHVPPSVPVNPALHLQAVITVLAIGDVEFAGHLKHILPIEALNNSVLITHMVAHICHTLIPAAVLCPSHNICNNKSLDPTVSLTT